MSAAVHVKQREGAAQLELSCSRSSECQDGAEQQEGQESSSLRHEGECA